MARLRTPNQKKKYEALKGRLNQYSYLVQTVYDTLNEEAAKIAESTGYDGEREFKWSDYPATKKRIDALQQRFVNEIQGIIHTGTSKEWKESNLVQDLLAGRVLKYYDVVAHGNKYQKLYYQTNLDALQAFQERVENGMSLSDRVWRQAVGYRRELECAISTGVERGMSAVTLSKRISKYLTDFPTLQADYKDKYGKVVDCLNCEYRSMRLARTEINMAYRVAEHKRWSQFDFVLGYEIKLSGSHPVTDICDSLKGRYPKDFKFVGWHPNCYCYCIPILKTEEEFWSDDEVTGIEEPPKSFGEWVKDNEERLSQAAERGTLPYWYTDNKAYVKEAAKDNKAIFDSFLIPKLNPKILTEEEFISYSKLMNIRKEQWEELYNGEDVYIDSSWSREINSNLSKKKIKSNVPHDFIDSGTYRQITTLDDVINKNKLPEDLLVYRKVAPQWLEREGISFKEGSIVHEYGYTSTSAVPGLNVIRKSRNVTLEIIAPKGSKAYITENIDESEIIFPRNSKFKVLSVKDNNGNPVIRMQLLEDVLNENILKRTE